MRKLHRKPKLVHGVGVNDADYAVNPLGPDKRGRMCPYYDVWHNMLRRAYDSKYAQDTPPTLVSLYARNGTRLWRSARGWRRRIGRASS
jgi:hypothetical protein